MLVLELGGRRYPVAAGEMIVGSDQDAALPVEGEGVAPKHAVVQGWADGSAAVRAVAGSDVLVNGVRLGPEPTPLLHGDKLYIAGQEILVVDQSRAGQTQLQRAIEIPDPADPRPSTPSTPSAPSTAARIVSLTDGRDYEVTGKPLVFGRDASADIVVAGSDVSRRHAELHARTDAFVLVDLSVNGTYVNGERVMGERRLGRGDVIRLGDEEFRFHAAALPATGPALALGPPVAPPGAAERLNDTYFGVAAATVAKEAPTADAPARGPLASLLVRSGEAKGERLYIRVPIANVGRGEYNDLVIADASVSTMHAKLQSRDGIWVIADLGSTNGTFVDGQLIDGEVPLGPGATIRFGEIVTMFEPLDESEAEPVAETIVMPRLETESMIAPDAELAQPALRRRPRPRPTPPPPNRTPLLVLLALLVIALVLAGFLMLKR